MQAAEEKAAEAHNMAGMAAVFASAQRTGADKRLVDKGQQARPVPRCGMRASARVFSWRKASLQVPGRAGPATHQSPSG